MNTKHISQALTLLKVIALDYPLEKAVIMNVIEKAREELDAIEAEMGDAEAFNLRASRDLPETDEWDEDEDEVPYGLSFNETG